MDDSQAYYWTPEWQANKAAAEAQIRTGEVERFDNVDDAIAWLLDWAEASLPLALEHWPEY